MKCIGRHGDVIFEKFALHWDDPTVVTLQKGYSWILDFRNFNLCPFPKNSSHPCNPDNVGVSSALYTPWSWMWHESDSIVFSLTYLGQPTWKMMNYFSNNFTIEESKASIEKEMICLDQYYHQQEASMNTAGFIIILLVCSLLTGVIVFALLNFLWKKFRSRRFEESRPGPRTVRDEELYIAGQKTWSQ